MMAQALAVLAQAALMLALSPLLTGLIRTLKARIQMRRGPGMLQPYRDLHKLLRKGVVIPDTSSWLFTATPYVVFSATLLAALMVPAISADTPVSLFGGVLALVYLLGLSRFFLALAGLDTGSSFGGLGSSREMTISSLAEPALMLAIFTVAIGAGSTNIAEISRAAIGQQWRFLAPAQILAFASMFLVLLAETGRIPVDNPATHLELTMIHEAMILEYSGPHLALLEWGAWIKQLLLMSLLINLFWPFGLSASWELAGVAAAMGWLALKLTILCCGVALVETANAKMRLFRVPELLAVAFVLGALACVSIFLF
jgi:formate hydrogenlyase subunit 4